MRPSVHTCAVFLRAESRDGDKFNHKPSVVRARETGRVRAAPVVPPVPQCCIRESGLDKVKDMCICIHMHDTSLHSVQPLQLPSVHVCIVIFILGKVMVY